MTAEHGLIKTVAQGARQAKSRFAGQIDLFVEAEFEWHRHRKSELHRLKEVHVLNHRFDLRKSYRNTLVASYFSQLLEMVLEIEHSEPEMHGLLQRAFTWLGEEGGQRKGVIHFEKEITKFLGLGHVGAQGIMQIYGKLPKSRDHCLDFLK